MSGADDLLREVNVLAAKIQHLRRLPHDGAAAEGRELAAMETRLTSLWTAIRAARAGQPQPSQPPHDRRERGRSRWD